MTPNQSHVAGLELARQMMEQNFNIGDERKIVLMDSLIQQVKSAPAEPVSREAVEVVAHAVDHPDAGYKVYKDFAIWMADGEWTHNSLMTVAQHNRIVAALTAPPSPDAELVRQCIAQELSTWEGDFKGPVQTAMRCLQARIDAKLAELSK